MVPTRLVVRDVLGPDGLAARSIEGFEDRSEQLAMAEAIFERLQVGGALAVEAPTGVGKTLAYLVPAILSGRRVLISTNTKTLQDQIVDKDLPLLARALGPAGVSLIRARDEGEPLVAPAGVVRWAVMKGRANYLCLDRLERRTRQLALSLDLAPSGAGPEREDGELEHILRFSRATEHGDRAELALPERSPLWAELDARAEICTGSRCARFDECFVSRMRRRAAVAEVVIVNHHLLLADLALRAEAALTRDGRAFGEVIPSADVLILDEAHALEEIASEYFGGRVSSRKLDVLARDIISWRAPGSAGRAERTPGRQGRGMGTSGPGLLEVDVTRAVLGATAVFEALPRGDGRTRLGGGSGSSLEPARERLPDACRALSELASAIELEGAGEPTADALVRRTRDLRDSLRFVLDGEDPDYVYWSERQGAAAALGASPVDVARLLGRHLFEVFGAVVMTSATLTAGEGGCGYFLRSVGAPADTDSMVLGSPFDYPRQAALYLPADAPEPDAPAAVRSLVRIGRELIELVGGGALFLFTSHRVMRQVHAELSRGLPFPVMLQGERPQRELLRLFVEQAPAVLCATASFWEGVDIPGDPLRLVLIDRLPFGSPGDPLVAARAERLEAEGGSAFNGYHLPRAILRLKQGFGRLVRSRTDRGVVAILDRRVQTKGYGKRFLRALPDAARIQDAAGLARWWAGEGGPEPGAGGEDHAPGPGGEDVFWGNDRPGRSDDHRKGA